MMFLGHASMPLMAPNILLSTPLCSFVYYIFLIGALSKVLPKSTKLAYTLSSNDIAFSVVYLKLNIRLVVPLSGLYRIWLSSKIEPIFCFQNQFDTNRFQYMCEDLCHNNRLVSFQQLCPRKKNPRDVSKLINFKAIFLSFSLLQIIMSAPYITKIECFMVLWIVWFIETVAKTCCTDRNMRRNQSSASRNVCDFYNIIYKCSHSFTRPFNVLTFFFSTYTPRNSDRY